MYDLSGFDLIYEPGDDVSGPDYPIDDQRTGVKTLFTDELILDNYSYEDFEILFYFHIVEVLLQLARFCQHICFIKLCKLNLFEYPIYVRYGVFII